MKTFDKLENRYIFTGALVTTEAMHIGSGEGDERADSLFVKSRNQFYIPGSSLRGALRSTVERIAYTIDDKSTCLLSSHPTCVTVNPKVLEDKKNEVEQAGGTWDESKILDFLKSGHLCDTCKIFGSTQFASKVKISDLYPISTPQEVIRHGVGIDRDTETASQGALFEIEVIEKGCRFSFELIAENLSEISEWGLLCIGISEMIRDKENGGSFYIGAKSSAGLGRCYLTDLKIRYFDQRTEYNLKKYLMENKFGLIEGNKAIEFIQNKVKSYLSPQKEVPNA